MNDKLTGPREGGDDDRLRDRILTDVKNFLAKRMIELGYNDPGLETFAKTVAADSFQVWYKRTRKVVSLSTFREFYEGKPELVLRFLLAGHSLEEYLQVCMQQRRTITSIEKSDPVDSRAGDVKKATERVFGEYKKSPV